VRAFGLVIVESECTGPGGMNNENKALTVIEASFRVEARLIQTGTSRSSLRAYRKLPYCLRSFLRHNCDSSPQTSVAGSIPLRSPSCSCAVSWDSKTSAEYWEFSPAL
jgi:hypothetical protein